MDQTKVLQKESDKFGLQLEDDSKSGLFVFLKIGFARSGSNAGEIDFAVTGGIERLKANLGPSRCRELRAILSSLAESFNEAELKEASGDE